MNYFVLSILLALSLSARSEESACFGTPSRGRLENGVRILKSGPNFAPYSSLGVVLGRTYVHSQVARVISISYASLDQSMPGTFFLYGESGRAEGGRFRPHRTHQNGLSVDFMVPVLDSKGKSVPLPAGILNKFGYNIEFNNAAQFDGLVIDFESIAEHLFSLYLASKENGVEISRVIFEPNFIPKLYATKRGEFIRQKITFMKGKAWIRHDEHYHVDFSVPCKSL